MRVARGERALKAERAGWWSIAPRRRILGLVPIGG